MKDKRFVIGSIASDLRRVSTCLLHKSQETASTFEKEALKMKSSLDLDDLDPYAVGLLKKMEDGLNQIDDAKKAENALMYSVLLQNYAQKFL